MAIGAYTVYAGVRRAYVVRSIDVLSSSPTVSSTQLFLEVQGILRRVPRFSRSRRHVWAALRPHVRGLHFRPLNGGIVVGRVRKLGAPTLWGPRPKSADPVTEPGRRLQNQLSGIPSATNPQLNRGRLDGHHRDSTERACGRTLCLSTVSTFPWCSLLSILLLEGHSSYFIEDMSSWISQFSGFHIELYVEFFWY